MSRRNRAKKREMVLDPVYNEKLVSQMVSKIMTKGKRAGAEKIIYETIENLGKKAGKPGVDVFTEAIQNVKPVMEVKSRRVGGANYQVPVEVSADRSVSLAIRWVVTFAKARGGKSMSDKLTNEMLDAFNKTGAAIKKKEDTHKMAEANKAFAHFRW